MLADGTVLIDTKINTDGAEIGTQEIEKTVVGLKDSLKPLGQAVKDIPYMIKTAFSSASKSVKHLSPEFNNLQDNVDRYEDALHRAERAGQQLGDSDYDEAYKGLQRAKKAAEDYKKSLSGISNNNKKASKSGNKFNKSLRGTEKSSKGAHRGLARMLATSILFSTVFRAISAITGGLKEGINNLAQYSNNTNKALSNLMSAMTRLKNSFASAFSPIVQYVEPVLTRFINYLSQAVTYVGKLFAALTGKKYFEQATSVQQNYAESLNDTSESADKVSDSLDDTTKSAKAAQKQLAAFDELNVLDFDKDESVKIELPKAEQKTELKPEDMYETVQIESDILDMAQRIKEVLAGLFNPIKESWIENGPYVMEALHYMASSAIQLASDMGSSFMQVWNTEGYGKEITDDLLISFGNLAYTAGNLVTNFDKAWISGETGTNILRHIGDLIIELTGFIRESSEVIKNWSSDINFSPLLESFDRVLQAINPVVGDVGDLLLWFLSNVLLPIAKWGVEQGVPEVFDLIAAALWSIHSVIEALKPLGVWLLETFLLPLGKWTGDTIIAALQKIVEWLGKFSDWINNHQSAVQYATTIILAFFTAWKFVQFVNGITSMLKVTPLLIEKFVSLLGSINPIIVAVGSILSLIGVLAQNWDKMTPSERVISGILAAASAIGILAVALGALTGGVGAAVVAASLAAGIAAATIAINAGKRQVSSYQSSSSRAGRSFYPASAYSAVTYSMPKLATGTVVPPRAGEFAAILGDNNRETEVVSPLSTMKQALLEALVESGITSQNQSGTLYMQVDGKTFARLMMPYMKSEESRIGVNLVTGGTT